MHSLSQHQVKNDFYYSRKKINFKSKHWRHADNRSKGISATEKFEQTAIVSIEVLAGIRYGFSLSYMIIHSH